MSKFALEEVLSVHHWNDTLFSFRTTRDRGLRFKNGQFVMIGRRKVIGASCALAIAFSLVMFPLLNSGSGLLFAITVCVTLGIMGIAYGPAGAALPEMFDARYRYTGAGLGYNLAGILGGALPPLAASQLVASGNSLGVGVMLACLSAISVVCVLLMKESSSNEIHATAEPDVVGAAP